MAYRYRAPQHRQRASPEKSRAVPAKLILVVIVAMIFASSTYYFYQQTVERDRIISGQANTIQKQSDDIYKQTLKLGNLTDQVSDLKNTLISREDTISNLADSLGFAEQQISELTPVVKSFYAIGVDSSGKGVVVPLEVKVSKGTGAISANIKNVDMLPGTQDSIRIAVAVASKHAGVGVSKKDVTVSFLHEGNDIVVVDGPSAGNVISVTVVAALQNKTFRSKIFATGAINSDGSVGFVGGIKEKAAAAASFGATDFLVPKGQGTTVSGINIVEVSDIGQVSRFLLQ